MALPGYKVKWDPERVEVARSGDIGYVRGTYELTITDPRGSPPTGKGKYIEVWKKQADESWKVVIDMFDSDLPVIPPPAEK